MRTQTIAWEKNAIKIIDQTKLPNELKYLYIRDPGKLWLAIKELKVRGAPALGVAAALGMYLSIKDSKAKDFSSFSKNLDKAAGYIASSRPTARNLFWGIEQICSIAVRNKNLPIAGIKKLIFLEAKRLIAEDKASCRNIGKFGEKLIHDKDKILTICNTGALAAIDYGTALGVIFCSKERGKRLEVFACETRPLLQGARLTTWELKNKNIPVTLLCDSMAATLMKQGKIDKVITGADRIVANGDAANKIGTYNLAVLSKFHKVPFYVAAPVSTFDLTIENGKGIPIEQRDGKEVTTLYFKHPMAAKNIRVFNPAFDVTPSELITAIITDRGVIYPPFKKNIKRVLKGLR